MDPNAFIATEWHPWLLPPKTHLNLAYGAHTMSWFFGNHEVGARWPTTGICTRCYAAVTITPAERDDLACALCTGVPPYSACNQSRQTLDAQITRSDEPLYAGDGTGPDPRMEMLIRGNKRHEINQAAMEMYSQGLPEIGSGMFTPREMTRLER